jgi:hypothetical protein
MNLFWRQTRFSWIASKTPFESTNRFVIEDGGNPPDNIHALVMKLFEYEGERVCVRLPEPDMESILKHGRAFSVDGLQLVQGDKGECHSNCSKMWLRRKRQFLICTGYGLTEEDQTWRQHTWLLERRNQRLVETTATREKYYGVEFNFIESFLFAWGSKQSQRA